MDVSAWQGSIDCGKVRLAGWRFVIAKATEGRRTDNRSAANNAGAMNAGLNSPATTSPDRVLWVAQYGTTARSVPGSNWGGYGWAFSQYSGCGSVPGISGCVDVDRYRSSDFTLVTY